MSELRELLGRAAPAADPLDVAALRRHVVRRRRSRRALGVAAAVVLAGGLTAGLATLSSGDDDARVDVIDRPGPDAGHDDRVVRWKVSGARAVALGTDAVWVAAEDVSARGQRFVARLHPETGEELARVVLEEPVHRIAIGLGFVWVLGGGDGAEPNGGVVLIDPATNEVVDRHGYTESFSPGGIAFAAGSAWVTAATDDAVLRLDPSASELVTAALPVGDQPTDIVAADDSAVWVRNSLDDTIAKIDPTTNRVVGTFPWAGSLLAAIDHERVWATEGASGGRLVELVPEILPQALSAALGTRIQVDATVVVRDPDGIWVGGPDGVARYTAAGELVPETELRGEAVSSVAATQRTVWFVSMANDGEIVRFRPTPGACSAAGMDGVSHPQSDLPPAVAEMRLQIVEAAMACDYERLGELVGPGRFTYSFGQGNEAPADVWREAEEAGGDPLRTLVQHLDLPHRSREIDGVVYYSWPSAFGYGSWSEVPESDKEALRPLYSEEDLASFAEFGGYIGYRVTITADGDWLNFVAGD